MIVRDLVSLVFMPLFFFISGFWVYKPQQDWTAASAFRFVTKKAMFLLVPTVVFISLYMLVYNAPSKLLFQSGRLGYWFTLALFEYYLLYALYRLCCNAVKHKDGVDWLLFAGSALLYFLVTQSVLHRLHVSEETIHLLGLDQLRFFCYFSAGTLAKKHFSHLLVYMENGKIVASCIIVFLGLFLFVHQDGFSFGNALLYHLYNFTGGYLSMFLVFLFFHKKQAVFAGTNKIGNAFRYVGRHTLSIYMLHYFFLPRNLQFVGDFFICHPNPVIELFVTMGIAVIVIEVSLLVNSMICTSPFLAYRLFGMKNICKNE